MPRCRSARSTPLPKGSKPFRPSWYGWRCRQRRQEDSPCRTSRDRSRRPQDRGQCLRNARVRSQHAGVQHRRRENFVHRHGFASKRPLAASKHSCWSPAVTPEDSGYVADPSALRRNADGSATYPDARQNLGAQAMLPPVGGIPFRIASCSLAGDAARASLHWLQVDERTGPASKGCYGIWVALAGHSHRGRQWR